MDKETFIIRTEWFEAINELEPIEQALVFRNLFLYHKDQAAKIKLPNLPVKLVWKLIEPNLKRNIDSYDKRKETSAENGKKGGRPPKHGENLNNLNKPNDKPINLTENLTEPNNPIVSVSVSDSVSVPESVSDSESVLPAPCADDTQAKKNEPEQPAGTATPVARPPSKPEQVWINAKCPFGDEVKEEWLKLCGTQKWRKKESSALQAALKRLMDFEEDYALKLLNNAIAGSYQGLVFANTDADYYQWLQTKNSKNGSRTTTHRQAPTGLVIPSGKINYGRP